MRVCGLEEFDRICNFYRHAIDNTENMTVCCRWIYGLHPTDAMISGFLKEGAMYCLEDKGEFLAVAAVIPYQPEEYHGMNWQLDLKDDEVSSIHLFAVNPDCFRHGIAKKFVNEIIAHSRSEGKKAVRLDVLESNIPAQKLYESLGFVKRDTARWCPANIGWVGFLLYEYVVI